MVGGQQLLRKAGVGHCIVFNCSAFQTCVPRAFPTKAEELGLKTCDTPTWLAIGLRLN